MSPRMDADPILMAEHITTHGVLQGDELRAALEWRLEQFYGAVYGKTERWFAMTIDGWGLTDHGREGLVSSLRRHTGFTVVRALLQKGRGYE